MIADTKKRDPQWPRSEVLQVIGSAQHHGVPTRLIDFTFNPLIALYFAITNLVSSWRRDESLPKHSIAIWAFYLPVLRDPKLWGDEPRIQIVFVARAGNRYLRAQQAIFLHDSNANAEMQSATPNFAINRIDPQRGKFPEECFRKITMPCSEVVRVYWLLLRENITLAHLLPSFDNVVAALEEWRDIQTKRRRKNDPDPLADQYPFGGDVLID